MHCRILLRWKWLNQFPELRWGVILPSWGATAGSWFLKLSPMKNPKKFYLVYEIEAENIIQAKAVAVDLQIRNGITPAGLYEKTEFNQVEFINQIKQSQKG
ncbi:MAG: hypothetical protein QM503_03865 [Bacteroidota bacterium]